MEIGIKTYLLKFIVREFIKKALIVQQANIPNLEISYEHLDLKK